MIWKDGATSATCASMISTKLAQVFRAAARSPWGTLAKAPVPRAQETAGGAEGRMCVQIIRIALGELQNPKRALSGRMSLVCYKVAR